MIDIKISLSKLVMPAKKRTPKKRCIFDRAKEWMDNVEDEEKGKKAWANLKKLYEILTDEKCKYKRRLELLRLINPVIVKFAQYDNDGIDLDPKTVLLDGDK